MSAKRYFFFGYFIILLGGLFTDFFFLHATLLDNLSISLKT